MVRTSSPLRPRPGEAPGFWAGHAVRDRPLFALLQHPGYGGLPYRRLHAPAI